MEFCTYFLHASFLWEGGVERSRRGGCSREFIESRLFRENRLSESNTYVGA